MQTNGSKGTGLAEPADPGLAPGLGRALPAAPPSSPA